ncbi:M48 family metallopeptidase, partial [bacterium]|nr:M48 family metallopeptidase [bacterium]
FPFRLVLLSTEEINAFALPGGTIAITEAMLATVHSDIGRAFVLGHEIGHIQHRHGLQRLGRSVLLAAALSLVGVDTSFLLKSGQDLAELSFSRAQEDQADTFGLYLVERCFGTTEGVTEFFEQMLWMEGEESSLGGERLSGFFRTHPNTGERLQHLRQRSEDED